RRDGFTRILEKTSLPEDIAIGGYELAAVDMSGNTYECMLLEVCGAVEITSVEARLNDANKLSFWVGLKNVSDKNRNLRLNCFYDGKSLNSMDVAVPPFSTKMVEMPVASFPYQGTAPEKLRFELQGEGGLQGVNERAFTLAQAERAIQRPQIDGRLDDWDNASWSRVFAGESVTYQSKRHRGAKDFSVRYALSSDENFLYLAFEVRDDVSHPSDNPQKPWLGDAVALVVGRDFDGNEEFKFCKYLMFALGSDGKAVVKQVLGTPPKGCFELDSGEVDCAIRRDDVAGITIYEIAIPRKTYFGEGEINGIGMSVYDADTSSEVKDDVHRDIPLNGGVPLFMGNKIFSTLLFHSRGVQH
ncbi:MAG: hypothetical protein JXR78_17380, partial [Victivallales bacterium]|nr:hypothetical protein [Victivallales bacterium]